MKHWLQSLSTIQDTVPLADIIVSFDNNQIFQRRWRVKLNQKLHCNVVTIIAAFEMGKEERLQHTDTFDPKWNARLLTEGEQNHVKSIDQDCHIKQSHYDYLYPLLEKHLQTVVSEQTQDNGTTLDHIDEQVVY